MINSRYNIIRKIGKGRSSVYLCSDMESFGKEIAMKVLSNFKDTDDLASFNNEYHNLKQLEHPDIIKAIESGTILESGDNNIPVGSRFFTLEYFPGKDLLSQNDYSESDLTEIIIRVSSLLFYLHQSNYIFYDLKPENILISFAGGKPEIKLIDFGLARCIPAFKGDFIFGTMEYIAPEILKREPHDSRVDLYSFGILLYRLIYNRFPFDHRNEIEVYKAHLEKEFDFPNTSYSVNIINIVRKLVSKEPSDRYNNTLEILNELDPGVVISLAPNWSPAKVFAGRTDATSILRTYLNDKTSSEVFAVHGSEGAGKSSLLNYIHSGYEEAILINYNKAKSGPVFINEFLRKVLFNESVFNSISIPLKSKIKDLISSPPDDLIEQVKAVFSRLSKECDFFILFDNFSDIDEFTLDVMKNIIPILQVNNKKFILAGDSDSGDLSSGFYNIRDIDLTSFTEANLLEFLEKSYFADFPIEDFKKLILLYADLLPGNITGFIKDILLWEVLDYSKNKIQVSSGDFAAKFLQGSHEDIYELRKLSLTPGELAVAELISLFDIPINMNTASVLSGLSTLEMEDTASSFLRKNIFHPVHLGNTLNFTSAGLKKYIYSDITDKKDRHFAAAQLIKDNIPSFNRVELARQFELSFRFKESYETIKEELTAAEKISAYSYKKKILRKYLSLPLGFDDKREIKTDLASVLYNLSEFRNAEDLVNELLEENLPVEKKDGLLILKGSCLIGAGEFEQGKVLFNELISRIDDVNKIRKLLTETANAEYELNNFDETSSICRKIISAGSEDNLEKAKCFNILGLVAVIRENNPSNALANFDLARNIYEKEGLLFRVAQIEKNMGNIYDMKREYDKAEQHWNKSLEISLSSGNLDLEAKILLNYGIYYFELLRFEDALENYNRALSIFLSLGNSGGQGLVQYNLGEIYLVTCEFEKAARSIESSVKIFNSLKNLNEELESLFLLGKIYYTAGSGDLLDSVIEIMQQKIEDEKSIAKHKINFNFLQQLACLPAANANDSVKLLSAIKEQFLELDDKTNFFFCAVQLINLFIRYGLFNEALLELNDPYFVTLCQENKLNNAEKNYLLALVSLNSGSGGNPVDYLLDAYSFVCESSITELTWKVLFELAGIYFERGNFHKSKEFNNYAVSVLDYIFNIIEENKFKSCVMDYPERKNSYNRLLTMQSSY